MKALDTVSKMDPSSQNKKPSSNLLIAGVTNDSDTNKNNYLKKPGKYIGKSQ